MLLAPVLGGCGKKDGPPTPKPTASAAPSAKPDASAAPTAASPSGPLVDAAFGGVSQWMTVETLGPCAIKARDLEQNLSFGGVAMSGGNGISFAFTWHLSTGNKTEGLVAFSGYDSQTRTLGPSHGLGKGILYQPQVYPSGDSWLAVWFDPRSLVFSRSTWAPTLAEVSRVPAVLTESRDDTAIAPVPDGSLAAATSFEVGGKRQLGVFTFAPTKPDAEPVHAVGALKGADDPRLPALVPLDDRFIVTWVDKGAKIRLAQMSPTGKELVAPMTLSKEGAGQGRPALAAAGGIVYVSWTEKDAKGTTIFVRAFDPKSGAAPPGYRVEAGYAPQLLATEEGAVLSFLRKGEGGPDILGVALDKSGKPAAKGGILQTSTNKKPIADVPHAAAFASDGRLGIAWTDTVERRAHMKTIMASCLGLTGSTAPPAASGSASSAASGAPAPSAAPAPSGSAAPAPSAAP